MHEPLPPDRKEERIVLVLQGGGALGAYQAAPSRLSLRPVIRPIG